MKPPLSYVPALPAAIGLMAGIVIYYSCPWWIWPAVVIVTVLLAFKPQTRWALFVCTFALLGALVSAVDRPPNAPDALFDTKARLTGEVNNVRFSAGSTRLLIRVGRMSLAGSDRSSDADFNCSLLLPVVSTDYRCGDIVSFQARLRRPEHEHDLPDEESFNPTFFIDGVTAEAHVSPDHIETVGHSNSLRRIAGLWHDRLADLIYMSPVSSSTAWFLSATLLGDDSMLDNDLKEQFRATGIAHYLALSGFHVGIIAIMAALLLFPLRTWSRAGRYRHFAVIILIWLYVFVCGLSPSLVRAAMLITVFLTAKVIGRRSSPYNSLAVAAIVILVVSPRQLFAPGFQMSFAAVLAILVFAPILNPFSQRRRILYCTANFITVPLAAMFGTCLMTLVHFHRLPLLFLLPNVLLAVLMPLLLGAGVLMMLAVACGLTPTWLGIAADYSYDAVRRMSASLARLPYAEINGIDLPAGSLVAAVAALLLLAFALKFRRRYAAVLAISAAIVSFGGIMLRDAVPSAELYITRRPLRTDIILREGHECRLLTSADSTRHTIICDELSRRYRHYLRRRGCADTLTVTDRDFSLPLIRRSGDCIIVGGKTIVAALSSQLTLPQNLRPDYMLLCRNSGHEPERLVLSLRPDTVLIAADMPPRRAARLKSACLSASIPTLDLHTSPFTISIP